MLVLSRKLGQEIVIDGNVRVRVLQCANGRVRLGIVAPRDVQVLRSEIAFETEHGDKPAAPRSQTLQGAA